LYRRVTGVSTKLIKPTTQTARHKEQNREKIVQAFEEIPEMIRTIDAANKLFGRDEDEDISGIAKAFYDELCKDIPDLIQILNGTRKSKFHSSTHLSKTY